MYEIDYKNLIIKNKKINTKKKFVVANITSDWSPVLEDVSDKMISEKEKYYGDLIGYFKKGNLNITNLETVIDNKKRVFAKNALRFINKPEVLKSLKSIDTHLVCLANNHIMDNGNIGLQNTIKNLKKYRINYVGAELSQKKIYKPFLFEKNNQKIAVINTSEGEEANEKYNKNIGASDMESYKIIDQIRSYKNKGYLVILIAHAGVEYIPAPPPYIINIYKNFVDEGADLVIGHHPHVLQGFEIYKNVPIFYSLGNFTMWKQNLRKNCYHSYFLNIKVQDNILSNINLVPFKINKNGLSLISKEHFVNKIIELNSFLPKSKKIWQEFVYRKNFKGNSHLDFFSFFYNFNKYKYKQLNKYTNLSQKYLDIDYFKNEIKSNSKYKYILNKWEINYERNFFSLFKNIFYIFYKFILIQKKMLVVLKKKFF